MQSRLSSFIESNINVVIKYPIAIMSQVVIFPLFNIHIPISDNLLIGAYFTFISIIVSYIIRRYFNKKLIHQNLNNNYFIGIDLGNSKDRSCAVTMKHHPDGTIEVTDIKEL